MDLRCVMCDYVRYFVAEDGGDAIFVLAEWKNASENEDFPPRSLFRVAFRTSSSHVLTPGPRMRFPPGCL